MENQKTAKPVQMTKEEYERVHGEEGAEHVQCPNCDGSGFEECFHCGTMIDCEKCDGAGDVAFYETPDLFKEQIDADKDAWDRWCESVGQVNQRLERSVNEEERT